MLITKWVTSQRRAKTGAQVWRTQKEKVSEGDLLHLHLQGDRVVKALDWKIPGLATHRILSLYPCCPEESLINASLNCAIGISSLSGLSQTYKRWWSNRYVPCKKNWLWISWTPSSTTSLSVSQPRPPTLPATTAHQRNVGLHLSGEFSKHAFSKLGTKAVTK